LVIYGVSCANDNERVNLPVQTDGIDADVTETDADTVDHPGEDTTENNPLSTDIDGSAAVDYSGDTGLQSTDGGSGSACGNGEINDGEECDGDNLANASCASLMGGSGNLSCTQECTFDLSLCGESVTATGGYGGGSDTGGMGGTGGTGGTPPVDAGQPSGPSGNAAEVCARWNADTADLSEGTWSGNVESCDPGDISPEGRSNALRMINLFRWLADLSPVQTDPELDRKAQACALLMRANNSLSHTPPQTWSCWTQEGADAAGSCNISTAPGVSSVAGYMVDSGNPTTIGHRRWILSANFGPTGLGSTDRASCMWTMGNWTTASKPWVAWPPAGVIPIQALGTFWFTTDSTGWTIQSDSISLAGAQVTVTSDGSPLQVTVTQLLPGYGSRYAIRFNPQGWQTQAGKIYSVSVDGVSQPISYQVEVVDCQ